MDTKISSYDYRFKTMGLRCQGTGNRRTQPSTPFRTGPKIDTEGRTEPVEWKFSLWKNSVYDVYTPFTSPRCGTFSKSSTRTSPACLSLRTRRNREAGRGYFGTNDNNSAGGFLPPQDRLQPRSPSMSSIPTNTPPPVYPGRHSSPNETGLLGTPERVTDKHGTSSPGWSEKSGGRTSRPLGDRCTLGTLNPGIFRNLFRRTGRTGHTDITGSIQCDGLQLRLLPSFGPTGRQSPGIQTGLDRNGMSILGRHRPRPGQNGYGFY